MTLTLHYHPLSSFCWKPLVGLYENGVPFTPLLVDLGDAAARETFAKVWPLTKFPVLQDDARDTVVPESSLILDYLDEHYPGPVRFTPADGDAAWRTRLWDRVFDNYIQIPMQRIVADRMRPDSQRDARGVADMRGQIAQAYALVEAQLEGRTWIAGDFGLADCAAAPALFYGDKVAPLGSAFPRTAAYLERLKARASFARVLTEAEPYFKFFPQ